MKLLEAEFTHSDSRRTIKQINTYYVKKGSTLGNHYHKETREYFFVMSGELYVDVHPVGSHETGSSAVYTEGDFFLVEPGEVHKFDAITDVKMMTLLTNSYQENPDTHVE